jgi:L-2-hydroxyglutarate oxidase
LGVHLTRTVTGDVHAGPNAVLGWKRESYRKLAVSVRDSADMLCRPAFWRFAAHNWREGAGELMRSLSKRLFTASLQRLVPDIRSHDLIAPHAGVRAQALGRDGRLIDDFALVPGPRSIHVCNAPSPAATASLCIGDAIAMKVMQQIPFLR